MAVELLLTRAPASKGLTAAQRAGLAYEKRVSAWLEVQGGFYPQVDFRRDNGRRFRPDGLLLRGRVLFVVEIKTQFTIEAQDQLADYMLWLEDWWPGKVKGVVICESYRREQARLGIVVTSLDDLLNCNARFIVLPLGIRSLPTVHASRRLGAADGMDYANGAAATAVRSGGCTRNDTDRIERGDILAA